MGNYPHRGGKSRLTSLKRQCPALRPFGPLPPQRTPSPERARKIVENCRCSQRLKERETSLKCRLSRKREHDSTLQIRRTSCFRLSICLQCTSGSDVGRGVDSEESFSGGLWPKEVFSGRGGMGYPSNGTN